MTLDTRTVVQVLGTAVCALGIVICLRLFFLKKADVEQGKTVSLGLFVLPALAFYKMLALVGFLVVPPAAVTLGAYHLLDGIKDTRSCMSCHVMNPMGNDMHDPHSNTLAARHYRNGWIPDQQCYHCHTDYGLSGTLAAKAEGFRHLARYTTKTYREPIRYKLTFNNHNCLHCHEGTPKFKAIPSHSTVWEQLDKSEMSCLNCHGMVHPTREQRTPGHADYDRLMGRK
jgi:cytochrome c nitrite reductase small subunit